MVVKSYFDFEEGGSLNITSELSNDDVLLLDDHAFLSDITNSDITKRFMHDIVCLFGYLHSKVGTVI